MKTQKYYLNFIYYFNKRWFLSNFTCRVDVKFIHDVKIYIKLCYCNLVLDLDLGKSIKQ